MTEKDNDSMATVQIKPDYAASEVYSTASEAPPAYKRQANSVKIAKITAFTVIISSFILGSFILASSYLQAKASCDQVQALDSVLEKELMLETLQQVNKEYPRAEALVGKENSMNNEMDLQNIEKDETKKEESKQQQSPSSSSAAANANSESDSSFSDSEETEDLQKIPNKVPLELDLSDLAAALLQNNQKSRMNCVVERKRAEEILDSPSKTVTLPFGMNLTTDPKKARVTGERISIFCEGGNEKNKEQQGRQNNRESDDDDDDDAEDIAENFRGPMFFPIQPIPFGRTPNQSPLTHMPQRMPPPQFQQLPIRPPMPQQIMEAPQPQFQPQQQTVRIHVQEIPYRAIHMADDVPVQIPSVRQDVPHYQVQKVPLDVALYRAGITSEDLRNIQHMAEERITDELRRLAAEEAAETSSDSENPNSVEEESGQSSSAEQEQQQLPQQRQQQQQPQPQQQQQQQQRTQHIQVQMQREQSREQPAPPQHLVLQHQQLPEQPRDTMVPPMPDQPQPMMHFGRAAYGRSLVQPVSIPVPMMQSRPEMSDEANESERPHYVQPRSIRSTDNLFQPESKRVKKCACDCNC